MVPRHSGQAPVASRALSEGVTTLWILLLAGLNKSYKLSWACLQNGLEFTSVRIFLILF